MRMSVPLLCAAGLLSLPVLAQEYRQDGLLISDPFTMPAPPGAPHAAAYLEIGVEEGEAAVLVGASSPASASVELHDMTMDDGVMRMRRVESIEVAVGDTLSMRPGGGYHLMLLQLEEPLAEGHRFPLTLEFAERGEIEVQVEVRDNAPGGEEAGGHHHHHH